MPPRPRIVGSERGECEFSRVVEEVRLPERAFGPSAEGHCALNLHVWPLQFDGLHRLSEEGANDYTRAD
jgi:hypothetical protein